MSDHFYKDILYPIQDKALALIGSVSSPFYLTGGTALSRFMLHHRFSDDLDLFINRKSDFFEEVDRLIKVFRENFPSVEVPVRQDSFTRIMVSENSTSLKIELVNDVGFRVGLPNKEQSGFQIDPCVFLLGIIDNRFPIEIIFQTQEKYIYKILPGNPLKSCQFIGKYVLPCINLKSI